MNTTTWIDFANLGSRFFRKAMDYMDESILLMRAQRESLETQTKLSLETQIMLLVLGQETDEDKEYLDKWEMNAIRRWRSAGCRDQDKCTNQELIDTIRQQIKGFKNPSYPI